MNDNDLREQCILAEALIEAEKQTKAYRVSRPPFRDETVSESDILKIVRLANKYLDIGLYIEIVFNDLGLTFRGDWNGLTLNRIYSYDLMSNTVLDLENLIDSFKFEFECKKKERNDL